MLKAVAKVITSSGSTCASRCGQQCRSMLGLRAEHASRLRRACRQQCNRCWPGWHTVSLRMASSHFVLIMGLIVMADKHVMMAEGQTPAYKMQWP